MKLKVIVKGLYPTWTPTQRVPTLTDNPGRFGSSQSELVQRVSEVRSEGPGQQNEVQVQAVTGPDLDRTFIFQFCTYHSFCRYYQSYSIQY